MNAEERMRRASSDFMEESEEPVRKKGKTKTVYGELSRLLLIIVYDDLLIGRTR